MLYVIVRGRVGVARRRPVGAELHVSVLGDGEFQDLLAQAPELGQVFEGAAQARLAALCDESAFLPGPMPL
jgi:hypothetical protein